MPFDWLADVARRPTPLWRDPTAIREELFSLDRLEAHARSLAAAQPVSTGPRLGHPLDRRLEENQRRLVNAFGTLGGAAAAGEEVTPASQWLLDNFHVVEEQVREIRRDLPRGYYRQLPKLVSGPFAGLPRVFGIAWAFVAHTDSRFEAAALLRFVNAYQTVQPLSIGELWAVAITLRLVLIENLRRIADRLVGSRESRLAADQMADRLLGAYGHAPEAAEAVLPSAAEGPLAEAFAMQLLHRLRDQDASIAPVLTWLDERLAAQGATGEGAVRGEHERQVAATGTVRNIITSLRRISEVDWLQLVEAMSRVDAALNGDGAFAAMDFPTRNLYRNAVEALARGSGVDELEVARAACGAAREAHDPRVRDVGYHLIGPGRRRLEHLIGFRRAWPARLRRGVAALGVYGYAAAILGLAGLLLAPALLALSALGGGGRAWLTVVGLAGFIPALEAAVALVNGAVTHSFRATALPALEFAAGVPSEHRTLVAVPMLLSHPDAVQRQVDALEVHHLASLDGDLHYALLSDWTDHDAEHAPDDAVLLDVAISGVAALNAKYGPAPGGDRFLLLHRRRVWSAQDQVWMGWERKRGKLHELNRLLRGAQDTSFIAPPGAVLRAPSEVRYVITLDADTRLPRDTVRRLVGKIAHPLNRPRLDPAAGRVVEGYGLLQPRITPSLPVGERGSLFQRLFSASSGLDPYAAAVSDVYQDLFGEGSYAGKGIYDVDAFEAALAGQVPEGTLLSHDLFEGIFARAGLASDVEVVEDAPSRYDVAAMRHHRWARGDWQLLPWVFGLPPAPGWVRRPLPLIGRLKMLDNLRRTLTAPAAVIALLAGWSGPPLAGLAWTLFILGAVTTPALMPLVDDLAPRRSGVLWRDRRAAMAADLRLAGARATLLVVLLAHQAWLMGDAIVRTLWRLAVTRRHLLQWTAAAELESRLGAGRAALYRRMSGGLLLAAAAALAAATWARPVWPLALAFAAAWGAAPEVARQISRQRAAPDAQPASEADATQLRRIARRTWRYFETYVSAVDNHLPPDNVQEDPAAVAHRTSPTNIGLYLLSVATARDLGWIGAVETVERLEATFATLERLSRFRGHFLNWYDTQDLRPLDPVYVSSVDSGNLAGHLIALANACGEWRAASMGEAAVAVGAADALGLALEVLNSLCEAPSTHEAVRALAADVARIEDELRRPGSTKDSATVAGVRVIAAAAEGLLTEDPLRNEALAWLAAAVRTLESHARDAAAGATLNARLAILETAARRFALEMEYGFLLDPERKLLSIGYRVTEAAQDANCYDLLASEARLASFVAIAKGDVSARHWFRLGHAVTSTPDGPALISWSGSMFEYLMPALVTRSPVGSVLERSLRTVVRQQIAYGRAQGRPWGVSESAFNARDLEHTYQYSNFGLPRLALKRGLEEQAVVAPYATALAALVDPAAAVENFAALEAAGAQGAHGFYEALDYTPLRVPDGGSHAVVRAFMAHHQGMTIVALADVVLGGRMRERFHAEPMVKAAELLLHERMPRDVRPPSVAALAPPRAAGAEDAGAALGRRYDTAQTARPATHVMSNGRYSVMLTGAGAGYSRWRDFAITRWREDATCDGWGSFLYLRDVRSGQVWSAGAQPAGGSPDAYRAAFFEDRAEIWRRDGDITTLLHVVVSAEDDAELRRLCVTNDGDIEREIEITSFLELALADPAADTAHPAFSKLFVETEHLAGCGGALLARRRQRAPDEPEIWAAHLLVTEAETVGKLEFETDRARFLGRGRTARAPQAVTEGRPLTGEVGAVLDPAFVLRRRLKLAPGATAHLSFWTFAAGSRTAITSLVDQHLDPSAAERAMALAWTHAQVQLRHLGVSHQDAQAFQRLAGHVLYASPTLRPPSEVILAGAGGQSDLWQLGISGDLPLVLLRIADLEHVEIARELLHAAEYWRLKRVAVDVVILNDRGASYAQDLQSTLEMLVRTTQARRPPGEDQYPGRVYVLRSDLVPAEVQARLLACARAVIAAQRGRLGEQLQRLGEVQAAEMPPPVTRPPHAAPLAAGSHHELELFNGFGGFARDGREYVVVQGPGQLTPAPWTNVIANSGFGCLVSAEGSGFTWASNSREHQLTPWSNDPVADRGGEAIYLRDRDSGDVWSPTAWPVRAPTATYVCAHGRGYSRYETRLGGLDLELTMLVVPDAPVKMSRLTVRNTADRPRRLSGIAYAEWVLGRERAQTAPFVQTAFDADSGAVFAQNRWDSAFSDRIAFLASDAAPDGWTADRREFIGRNGDLAAPAALWRASDLAARAGAGLDPCAAIQRDFDLAPGASAQIIFLLGETEDAATARSLIAQCRTRDFDEVLGEVERGWAQVLDKVQVETPDRALDLMLNGRFLYQTLASRLWARAGFYQASGAYGFRDQLQDIMALADPAPRLAREHLLRAAARQFPEGDVQHWWLAHTGQGVRTRISDDRLWLPFVVAHYLAVTKDHSVLAERVPFLKGEPLQPQEMESFFRPETGADATLFEHCARALDASLAVGGHGLPLIGGGDWNDGMNRVGRQGRGESVWLGWFLHAALSQFAVVADKRGESDRAAPWRAHAEALARALESQAWDGDWYRRGWYDDGAPLGSAASEACRIDAIAQSWAVLSGACEPKRGRQALQAVERELVDVEAGLALLFAPPFDAGAADPGYIKGYPPGVRENGGQYTHAAAWTVMALATLGEGDRAGALMAMLNPINHSRTRSEAQRYKVEPYVVAADVYAHAQHRGRGGWTWYTGAAGWLHRAGLESLLGVRPRGESLELDPCIPHDWPGFRVVYRHGRSIYSIVVDNPEHVCRGVALAEFDGGPLAGRPVRIPLRDDGGHHEVRLRLGAIPEAGDAA